MLTRSAEGFGRGSRMAPPQYKAGDRNLQAELQEKVRADFERKRRELEAEWRRSDIRNKSEMAAITIGIFVVGLAVLLQWMQIFPWSSPEAEQQMEH